MAESNVRVASDPEALQAQQAPQPGEVTFDLEFTDPDQVYTFFAVTDGEGTLLVDTEDCCVPGDRWGVRIIGVDLDEPEQDEDDESGGQDSSHHCEGDDLHPQSCVVAETCGNGSITAFSGLVRARHLEAAVVEVFYCRGVDMFPAGMTVRFRYTGERFVVLHGGSCISADRTCQVPPL